MWILNKHHANIFPIGSGDMVIVEGDLVSDVLVVVVGKILPIVLLRIKTKEVIG